MRFGNTAYPWTYEVTKCVVEGAFDDLEKAYANFFAGRAEYPKYKKEGQIARIVLSVQ